MFSVVALTVFLRFRPWPSQFHVPPHTAQPKGEANREGPVGFWPLNGMGRVEKKSLHYEVSRPQAVGWLLLRADERLCLGQSYFGMSRPCVRCVQVVHFYRE